MTFGGADAVRAPLEIDVDSFAMVKGIKAKGKRVTTWQVDSVEELEPLRQPEEDSNGNDGSDNDGAGKPEEDLDPDAGKSQQQIIDEMTGQLNLFND